MTSPPSPPNRRRRRIVVVFTIAVLVLGLGWWFLRPPRSDQRFVGKWKCRQFKRPFLLSADGTGVDDSTQPMRWWVDDDKLVFDYEIEPLAKFMRTIKGLPAHRNDHDLVDVQPDSFSLKLARDTSDKTFVLMRVE